MKVHTKDDEPQLDTLVQQLKRGEIDRRKFLSLAGAAGITAVSANMLFGAERMECNSCSGSESAASAAFEVDPNTQDLINYAHSQGVDLVWDRGSPCFYSRGGGAGAAGLCCFRCNMGPCTLGSATHVDIGACGATIDVIVARGMVRRIAGGAASHVEHARAAARTLRGVADKTIADYTIKDPGKLRAIYNGLGLPDQKELSGRARGRLQDQPGQFGPSEEALAVAEKTLEDMGKDRGTPAWLEYKANDERKKTWETLGILPTGATTEFSEALHRTTMGVDADMVHLATDGLKLGLVDGYCGLHAATNIQDVLFGTPMLKSARAGLSVIKENEINVVVNGHEPILSEKIVSAASAYNASHAASTRINVVGMCCTGNEVLMRRGVDTAGSMVQQELAIATGAVEAMVVDVQCVLPNCQRVVEMMGLHTKVITTNSHAKITGATHIPFEPENGNAIAEQIVGIAVANYANRGHVHIPTAPPAEIMVGFSAEQILAALGAVSSDPVGLLIDVIAANAIRGIVGIVGCVTSEDAFGFRHVTLSRRLLAENILVVGTGCWAHAAAQYGLMKADPAYPGIGEGLKGVLQTVAAANGLAALPGCWHMGSCVDNSRIEDVLNAVAGQAGVRIDQLPVAASAPEFITEKASSIGTWAVDLGLFTHVGGDPYVKGSANLVELLTDGVEGLVGGKFYVESDPDIAADTLIDTINKKRADLGWAF